jgi:copper transporter 1
MCVVNSKT